MSFSFFFPSSMFCQRSLDTGLDVLVDGVQSDIRHKDPCILLLLGRFGLIDGHLQVVRQACAEATPALCYIGRGQMEHRGRLTIPEHPIHGHHLQTPTRLGLIDDSRWRPDCHGVGCHRMRRWSTELGHPFVRGCGLECLHAAVLPVGNEEQPTPVVQRQRVRHIELRSVAAHSSPLAQELAISRKV